MSQWEENRLRIRFYPLYSRIGPVTKKEKLIIRPVSKLYSREDGIPIDRTFAPKRFSADVLKWCRQSVFGDDCE